MNIIEQQLSHKPELKARIAHFDWVDVWRRAQVEGGVAQLVIKRIEHDFMTAMKEDLLPAGSYTLWFIEGEDGKIRLTHPTYPNDDLEEMAAEAVKKARMNGRDGRREEFERVGVGEIRRLAAELEEGDRFFWTSPPGKIEAGYLHQTSMTYVGEVTKAGREVRIYYCVSALDMRGHARLYEQVTGGLPVIDPDFFVSSVVPIRQGPEEVFGLVDQLVEGGFENPEADLSGHVGGQLEASSLDQMTEAGEFLAEVFRLIEKEIGGREMSQSAVDALERAYEMAYKIVAVHAKNPEKRVVRSRELMDDFLRHEKILASINDGRMSRFELETLRNEARGLLNFFDERYGLGPIVIGGVGCPGGELGGLGFGPIGVVETSGLMGRFQAESVYFLSRSLMKCVRCPFCHRTVDAIVTSSHIECPKCGARAEK